jgi:hypothetical protein
VGQAISGDDLMRLLNVRDRLALQSRAELGFAMVLREITDPIEQGLALHLIRRIDAAIERRMARTRTEAGKSLMVKSWYLAAKACVYGPLMKLGTPPTAREILHLTRAAKALVKIIAEVDDASYEDIPELKGQHDITNEQYRRGITLGLLGFCGKIERMQKLLVEASSIVSN